MAFAALTQFHPKLFALVAIILAFPPVFTNFGKNEGLRLSLALFLFYFFRGLVSFLLSMTDVDQSRYHPLFHTNRIFHFAEIPLSLGAVYFGLQWIPSWLVEPYEGLLLSISPLVTIMEGLASMIIITSSGQGLSNFLEQSADYLQIVFGLVCLALYSVSSLVVFSLYYSGQIHTLVTASLVAVVLTLTVVLTGATIMLEHGVITDSALVFLYITYNIWTLTNDEKQPVAMAAESKNLFNFLTSVTWSAPSQDSLVSLVGSLFKMFSIELLTGLFIQMSILLMATRLIDNSEEPEEVKAVKSFSAREWIFNVLWPCFGKALLILIYTYSWLAHGMSAQIPWYIQPALWRWINIFFCLTLYMKHLLVPTDDEYAPIWPHSD